MAFTQHDLHGAAVVHDHEADVQVAAQVLGIYSHCDRDLTSEERALVAKAASVISISLTTSVTVQDQPKSLAQIAYDNFYPRNPGDMIPPQWHTLTDKEREMWRYTAQAVETAAITRHEGRKYALGQ